MQEVDPVGTVCEEVGEDAVAALVAGFYRRVAVDDILRPMYPDDDLPGAEQRLADFLIGRFGGSDRYMQTRGHPRLRMRHVPFAIDQAARDRWVQLMDEALEEAAFPPAVSERVRVFLDGVATFLINRA